MSSYHDRVREACRRPNGQFGPTPAAPPATSLADALPGTSDPPEGTIRGEDLITVVSRIAASASQLRRLPSRTQLDDVIQDACTQVISTYGTDRIPLGPVRKVVTTTISHAQGHPNLGSTDRRAMTALRRRRDALEDELGRPLTPREEDALAREVRQAWTDPRHRPSRDFLQRARMSRTASLVRENGSLREGAPPWAAGQQEAEDDPVAPGTAMDRIEQAVQAGRHSDVRRSAWDAMAELAAHDGTQDDVPRVRAAYHRDGVTAWCRRVLDDYPGGVLGAVDTWQRAEQDEGTTALFAPFGDIDEQGRDAVCRMLSRHPETAEELWRSALAGSLRPRSRRQRP